MFGRSISPPKLPVALPLSPPETPFTEFILEDIVPIRYVGAVFPQHSERPPFAVVIEVSQIFDRKPVTIGATFAQSPRPLERLQRQFFVGPSHPQAIIVCGVWR